MMRFIKRLFVNKKLGREQIRSYVNVEFREGDRDAAYIKFCREAGFMR